MSRKWGASGDAADRLVMSVSRTARGGSLVIQTAQHVDIVAEWCQWIEGRRKPEIPPGLRGNPVALGYAVAVEPENKTAFDWFGRALGGIGRARRVEHA